MIEVTHFTDPACPFAFSAEPARLRLEWLYGEGLAWTTRMIVLTREAGEGAKLAEGAPGLQRKHGMPIDPVPYAREFSTEPACLAFVAARSNAPERADALLRRLRVRIMLGELPDEAGTIEGAARDVGLDPAELRGWTERDDVRAALEADAAAARAPVAAARALDQKLSGPAGERRYAAPTYLLRRAGADADAEGGEDASGGCEVAVPGFVPAIAYEAAIANLDPELPRRPAPGSVEELLEWAPYPLASAEAIEITGWAEAKARSALAAAAEPIPAGAELYWRAAG